MTHEFLYGLSWYSRKNTEEETSFMFECIAPACMNKQRHLFLYYRSLDCMNNHALLLALSGSLYKC